MGNFIGWLDGKKTAIGALILLVFTTLATLGVKVPSVNQNAIVHYIDAIVNASGVVLTVWGIVHKMMKGDFSAIKMVVEEKK